MGKVFQILIGSNLATNFELRTALSNSGIRVTTALPTNGSDIPNQCDGIVLYKASAEQLERMRNDTTRPTVYLYDGGNPPLDVTRYFSESWLVLPVSMPTYHLVNAIKSHLIALSTKNDGVTEREMKWMECTSHSLAMRKLREEIARSKNHSHLVIIDDDQHDGGRAARARDPYLIEVDGSDSSAMEMLMGSASGLGLLHQSGSILVRHPFQLPERTETAVMNAMKAEGPRVAFLLTTQEIREFRNRGDKLWHRLAKLPRMIVPTVNERRDEIPHHIYRVLGRIPAETVASLMMHRWRGFGEFLAMIDAASKGVDPKNIRPEFFPGVKAAPHDLYHTWQSINDDVIIREALKRNNGMVAKTAEDLGVPERTLRRNMRRLGIEKEEYRKRARDGNPFA